MSPYETLRTAWPGAPSIGAVLSGAERNLCISGENSIHTAGFFTDLKAVMASVGEARWWLLDLDGDGERSVEFSSSDTEADYFQKLQAAPEWAPELPFPYAVCCQCFIGRGDWLLLSDRDGERMHLIVRDQVGPDLIGSMTKLAW